MGASFAGRDGERQSEARDGGEGTRPRRPCWREPAAPAPLLELPFPFSRTAAVWARVSGPQRVRHQPHHFSFFSSPFDVEASVPSLDSVTAAGSI